MILQSTLEQVINQQETRLRNLDGGLPREVLPKIKSLSSHALIISGIRRCGKSTLMLQMINKMNDDKILYLNFESPLLYGFSLNDFSRLDAVIDKRKAEILFLDEIQLVDKWEIFVRQKLDEGLKVIVTGSNAALLSLESGTKLTGRHITRELFPFSYQEFLRFKKTVPSVNSLNQYLSNGGFPEYLKTEDEEQLITLFDDIIMRDIVARYGIKDIRSLQRLAAFLIANVGNRITATKLKQPLSIGATSTILAWFSHLELSYLFFFVPMFSPSEKAQLINPKKVYAIDPGMPEYVSQKPEQDRGRRLENLIFLHLRRKYKEIYYLDHKGKGECDFLAFKGGVVQEIIQVCYELTPDNMDREVKGIVEAMRYFNYAKATIVTFSQKDKIIVDTYEIEVVPAWEKLME